MKIARLARCRYGWRDPQSDLGGRRSFTDAEIYLLADIAGLPPSRMARYLRGQADIMGSSIEAIFKEKGFLVGQEVNGRFLVEGEGGSDVSAFSLRGVRSVD